jgi:hypothetical protein
MTGYSMSLNGGVVVVYLRELIVVYRDMSMSRYTISVTWFAMTV